ncbi:hypothetical protein [Bombilactobacillus bombi]|uniref:hypothetical protein n=1 Tax=Bombilactobacillus bombi TaxID=1303590 RepID=UPI0035E9C4E5
MKIYQKKWLFTQLIFILGTVLGLIYFSSFTTVQAASTNNQSALSNVLQFTQVPQLSQSSGNITNSAIPSPGSEPLPPASDKLEDADNPYYDAQEHNLDMYKDGSGGYIAVVYTAKGFLEAVFDPACYNDAPQSDNYHSGWTMNNTNHDGWKTYAKAGSLYGQMNVTQTYLPISKIHKVIFENDIDMDYVDNTTALNYYINVVKPGTIGNGNYGAGGGDYNYVRIRHDKFDIDGNGFRLNMGWNNLALIGRNGGASPADIAYKEDWTLENISAAYGTTYFGIISCNTGVSTNYDDPKTRESGLNGGYTWVTYKNINYIGSQFSWTQNGTSGATIDGTVTANSVFSYREPGNPNFLWRTETSGNQQIFQEDRIIFGSNCDFWGSTYNGNGLQLTGSAEFKDGSKVHIFPHGQGGEGNLDGLNYGITFTTNNPKLRLEGDAQLQIVCDTHNGNDTIDSSGNYHPGPSRSEYNYTDYTSVTAGAFRMNSGLTPPDLSYKGIAGKAPAINIIIDGRVYNDMAPVRMDAGIANLSHGDFHILAKNLGNYTGANGLMQVVGNGMKIRVKQGGDFSIIIGDSNRTSTSPLSLLYGAGMDIAIDSPKSVILDKKQDPQCSNDYLVNGGNSTIKVYNSRVAASGVTPDAKGKQPVSIGMNGEEPLRVEALELPFSGNYIMLGNYLTDDSNIQAMKQGKYGALEPLKTIMAQMQTGAPGSLDQTAKEFDYIRLQDLPAPTLDNQFTDWSYLTPPATSTTDKLQRMVTGSYSGDEWEDDKETTPDKFIPEKPLIGVQVKRLKKGKQVGSTNDADYDFIDLGNTFNTDQADRKYNTTRPVSGVGDPLIGSITVPVTPNKVNTDGTIFDSSQNISTNLLGVKTDPKDPYNVNALAQQASGKDPGTMHSDGGGTPPVPRYIDPQDITWDDHKFTFDLQKVLDDYNDRIKQYNDTQTNPANKKSYLYLKSSDKIVTHAVTNFQQSYDKETKIISLMLGLGKIKPYYLLGEKINLPLNYMEGDATQINLTGHLTSKDSTGKYVDYPGIADQKINHTLDKKELNTQVDLPWQLDNITPKEGSYDFFISGSDDAKDSNNQGNVAQSVDKTTNKVNEKGLDFKYQVIPFPAYEGKQLIGKSTTPYDKSNKEHAPQGVQDVTTTFVPDANQELDGKIYISQADLDAGNGDLSANASTISQGATITATYKDGNRTITSGPKTFEFYDALDSNSQKEYSAADFWKGKTVFPAGTTFTIKYKINFHGSISAVTKADELHFKPNNNNDYHDVTLSTSNRNYFNVTGSVILSTPDVLDFGTHKNYEILKQDNNLYPDIIRNPYKRDRSPLRIINTSNVDRKVSLDVNLKYNGVINSNNPLDYLYYYTNGTSGQPLTAGDISIVNGKTLKKYQPNSQAYYDDISKTWNTSIGPRMKIPKNTYIKADKYNAKLEWTLTDSIN